jgi:hypothetical protein
MFSGKPLILYGLVISGAKVVKGSELGADLADFALF